MSTVAPATGWPCGSTTRPTIEAEVAWPNAGAAADRVSSAVNARWRRLRFNMGFVFRGKFLGSIGLPVQAASLASRHRRPPPCTTAIARCATASLPDRDRAPPEGSDED